MSNSYLNGPETARLRHRAFEPNDAEVFYRLNSHADVMRYTCEPMLESVEQARAAIEAYSDFETAGYGRWACVSKDSSRIVGFCGLKYIADMRAVDVGYRFFPEVWGQGFATEAALASVRFGFEELKLDRVIAMVKPENAASIRVLAKVGLSLVGPTNDCHGSNLYEILAGGLRTN